MGAHNFTITYDDEFSDISMPFNDIALTLKCSIPTTKTDDSSNIKLGVKTEYLFDDNGNIVGVIPKAWSSKMKLDTKNFDSHTAYEKRLEAQLYE